MPTPPQRSAKSHSPSCRTLAIGAAGTVLSPSLSAAAYINEQLRAAAGALSAAAQAQIDALRIQTTVPPVLWTEIELARKAGEALTTEDARKATQEVSQQALKKLAREAAHRHLLRALYSPNQLLEQMRYFWFNHFNVRQYKVNIRALWGDYEERAIRPHALGCFRDLLGAVSTHLAMLRYLDNEQNAAARINENFARELLECHTLGVNGGYSPREVQELARVLTGHGVNLTDKAPTVNAEQAALYRRDGIYEFNPGRHDFGDKAWLGRNVKGRGAAELDEVLNQLVLHPATARFVCGKLARHFLGGEAPAPLLKAMTTAWARSAGLFKTDEPNLAVALREQAAFPQLARPIYWQAVRPQWSANTRQALDNAGSPQDWNALYLSAPEFMYC
jgi:uncharacterized protein (DUF1800 family)